MRNVLRFCTLLIFLLPGVGLAENVTSGSLEYYVSMSKPHTHYFDVEIRLKNYKKDAVELKIPVWTPGSYLIREYAKNVERFQVYDASDGRAIPFRKKNKNTWQFELKGLKEIVIKYSVYANAGSVRMSYIDDSHAFIMANTLLMYVEDLRDNSSILKLEIPEKWEHISTSLSKIEGQNGAYFIPNYDILVDSPIEIGNHDIVRFEAAGVPHEIAMHGRVEYNPEKLKRDITKIVETSTEIFGENPNEKYVFIVHNTSKRGGGLEHMSSTVLGVNRDYYSNDYSYNSFLSLVAHEYIHLWLVKRIKPVELERLDYDKEMYTDLLWVMEGFTSYLEEKVMLRAGFYDKNQFLNNMVNNMANQRNLAGAKIQSVADASFDAWIKFYRKDNNSSNTQVSYYSKGMLLGALMDLEIIRGSAGEHSLDDVMNTLYYKFYKKKGKGITAKDLKIEAEKIGKIDLDGFFKNYVYGTEELNNEQYLHYAGIGLIETNSDVNSRKIGVNAQNERGKLIISSIESGSSAFDGGLNIGDELIAINDYRLSEYNYKDIISKFKINEKVRILFARDGLIDERQIEIRHDNTVAYTYEILDNLTKQQKMVFDAWLNK
jgi:predicted metalloprotease with PDZ domain